MPFMDGMDLIKEVKNNDIKCKIVIFSGYEEFEYAKFATKMGVINYILNELWLYDTLSYIFYLKF